MTNNKHAINAAKDMQNLKMRVPKLQGLHRDDAGDRRLDGGRST